MLKESFTENRALSRVLVWNRFLSAPVFLRQLIHSLPLVHGFFQLHALGHCVAAAGVDSLDLLHLGTGQGIIFWRIPF